MDAYNTGKKLGKYAFEKNAIDLISLAIGGAGMHMGTNAFLKHIIRGNRFGRKAVANTARLGFRHGAHGRDLNPVLKGAFTTGFGPEILEEYDMARKITSGLGKMAPGTTPENRLKAIQSLHGMLQTMRPDVYQNLRNTPMLGRLAQGLELESAGAPLKTLGNLKGFHVPEAGLGFGGLSKKTGFGAGALGAMMLGAIDPHIAMGGAVNLGRKALVSHPRLGQWYLSREFKKGLRGEMPGRMKRFLGEHALSPAIFDARDIGNMAQQYLRRE